MPSTFTLDTRRTITAISTYHWPGYTPGTIGLQSDSGTMYGPWQASGCPGMGGRVNAYWVVYPNVQLPPGTYSIVDSGQSTWSYVPSDCTGARGICQVFARIETSSRGSVGTAGCGPQGIVGTWSWFNGDTANIKSDGTMTSINGGYGTWKLTDANKQVYTLNWQNGQYIDTLTLSADCNSLVNNQQGGSSVAGQRK